MTHERDQEIRGWFAGRIPSGWFTGAPAVTGDREEVLLVGELAPVEMGADATPTERAAASRSRVEGFREETREQRMRIAEEAEHRFGRKVSWGVRLGEQQQNFTTLSVPVMTRLRIRERKVLDTLVDAGVARSRSDALAWCVRLVGDHQGDWIEQLREALGSVESVRAAGPRPGSAATEAQAEGAAEG
jgi:hypothetical protein